jgi:hypothetical protein
MKTHQARAILLRAMTAIVLIVALTACGFGSSDDDDPTPTATTSAQLPGSINVTVTVTVDASQRPGGSLDGLVQNLSVNGCRVTIPLDWVSVGDGGGTTASGARFTLYGGAIASNQAWENAVSLVADQANRQGAQSLTRGGDWIYAVLSNDRGFTFRARFDDRYCDFSVLGVRAIPETERGTWDAIAASLKVAPADEQTPES